MAIEIRPIEVKPGVVHLLALGETPSGTLYQPFPHTKDVVVALQSAGFRPTCAAVNGDEHPVYGWLAPKQIEPAPPPPPPDPLANIVFVKVQSDSVSGKEYTVAVDADIMEAIECNCPAGKRKVPCKHLYRALTVASGAFKRAAEKLIAQRVVKGVGHFHEQFAKKVEQVGKSEAVAAVIRKAYGDDHPLAHVPQSKGKAAAKPG